MNILGIDTTTKKASVALLKEDNYYISSIDNEATHSEKLLPLIDKVLKDHNLQIKDIDIFACVIGPGSFTGIRIGLATIKGLAKVTNSKIFATTSLELLARSGVKMQQSKYVIPLIDAKNRRAYAEFYKITDENNFQSIMKAENKYIEDILEDVQNVCKNEKININDVLFVVDSENLLNLLQDSYFKCLCSLDMETLIKIASKSSNFENYLTLDACYVRQSEAERTKYGE